jgi:hypothetical protein
MTTAVAERRMDTPIPVLVKFLFFMVYPSHEFEG